MPDYALVTELDEARQFAEILMRSDKPVGFDIETGYLGEPRERGSLDPDTAFVAGFSFTNSNKWARYVPLRHDTGPNLDPEVVWNIFRPVLEHQRIIAHNAGFEGRFMQREGINLNIFSCSQIEAYMTGKYERQGLKDLVWTVFGHEQPELVSLFQEINPKTGKPKKPNKKKLRFNPLDPTRLDVIEYACEDAVWTLALHHRHFAQVKDKALYDVEMQILHVVMDMEDRGVAIDFDMLNELSAKAKDFSEVMRQDVLDGFSRLTGREVDINLNSSQQLSAVIFDELGFSVRKKTEKGKMSTSDVALNTLSKSVPEIARLLEYRKVTKLIGSYLEKWPRDYGKHPTGRAHPSWKQNGVPSGRFSVNNPPVQQCPKHFKFESKGETLSGNFRDSIIAAPGFYFLDFDYSQIELRVMAGMSGEQRLIDAFNSDEDVHSTTAAMMLDKPLADITKDDRAIGKTMNFALLYGMQEKSLAERLAVSLGRAKLLYRRYFEAFSSVRDWMDEMKFQGESQGYVTSFFGRTIPIWEFRSDNRWVRLHGERLCVNAPVQGSAADYAKMAMVNARDTLRAGGLWNKDIFMVLNNHDELLFEVRDDIPPQQAIDLLQPSVEFPIDRWPKIVTDWESGQRWGSLQARKENA